MTSNALDATEFVRVSHDDDAIRICLDRPPVNAFTVAMFEAFAEVMTEAKSDPRPMLITGASGFFSAGYDIKQPPTSTAVVNAAARACVRAVQQHPAPTVAAVEGAAVGLGLLIATSADILVIARSARLRMPEVTLGITSDIEPLRRFLPDAWIRRMCLLGETFGAQQLHFDAAGAQLCEPGTALECAEAIIASMSGNNASVMRQIKTRLYD